MSAALPRRTHPVPIGFRAKAFDQEVDENSDFGRQVAGFRVDGVDVAVGLRELAEHRFEAPGA